MDRESLCPFRGSFNGGMGSVSRIITVGSVYGDHRHFPHRPHSPRQPTCEPLTRFKN